MKVADQILFFDADDTLWENNVYFERAISAFISYLDHRVHTAEEVRACLNAVERETVAAHGYGLKSFRRSLARTFEDLTAGPVSAEKHGRITRFVDAIAEQEMELLPGVPATLAELSGRHRLILVTKGDDAEQREKLGRSGLADCFAEVEVLREKHDAAYRELAEHHKCRMGSTWMVGNSPKSDINPALAAGLNAVFVPHENTWVLEHEEVEPPEDAKRLIKISRFEELLKHF